MCYFPLALQMYHFASILLLPCLWLPILSLFFKRQLNTRPLNDDGSLWLNTVFKHHKKSSTDFAVQPEANDNIVNGNNKFKPISRGMCTEGVERTLGPIVFTCTNGREQISHCLSADSYGTKIRIKMGQTAPVKNFLLRCSLENGNLVRLQPVACIHEGQIYQPGSRFTDRATQNHAFFYICERTAGANGGGIHMRSGGCVDDNGRFLTSGYFNRQGRRMMCQINSDGSIIAQSA